MRPRSPCPPGDVVRPLRLPISVLESLSEPGSGQLRVGPLFTEEPAGSARGRRDDALRASRPGCSGRGAGRGPRRHLPGPAAGRSPGPRPRLVDRPPRRLRTGTYRSAILRATLRAPRSFRHSGAGAVVEASVQVAHGATASPPPGSQRARCRPRPGSRPIAGCNSAGTAPTPSSASRPVRRGGRWPSRVSSAATCSPCRTPGVRLPSCSPSTASLSERRASPPSPDLVAATRAAGEVLAMPESSGPAFNDGRLGAWGPADDVFAIAIIRQLAGSGSADPRRITVAGFSNGAGMAMRLAAEHPGLVAAVVSVDGELLAGAGAPRPTAPVRIYLVHGTADLMQPWSGRGPRGVAHARLRVRTRDGSGVGGRRPRRPRVHLVAPPPWPGVAGRGVQLGAGPRGSRRHPLRGGGHAPPVADPGGRHPRRHLPRRPRRREHASPITGEPADVRADASSSGALPPGTALYSG